MQGYHFDARNPVSRAKGQNAVAKAAYNAREALRDERTGELKDYSRTHDNVLFSGIFVDPKRNTSEWVQDRSKLWNEAVKAETYKNAQEAQEIIISLPHQLTDKGREYIVKDWVRETILRETGRVADVNIHRPPKNGDDRNYHAHVLLTMRDIGPDGFGEKKAPVIDKAQLDKWKVNFSNRAARELRKEGFALDADRWKVGHLAKPEQLKDALRRNDFEHAAWAEMEATTHRGPTATTMDRNAEQGKGPASDRGTIERERKAAELQRMKLAREMKEGAKTVAALERELAQDHATRREAAAPHSEQLTPQAAPKQPERETPQDTQRPGRPAGERHAAPHSEHPTPKPRTTPKQPERERPQETRAAPSRERPLPPQAPHESVAHLWMAYKNGYDDLKPELQKDARIAYERWQAKRVKANKDPSGLALRGYVSFVQKRWQDDGRKAPERKPIKGGKENKEVGRVVSRSVGMAGRGLSKALDVLGGMVESLAAPPKPLTKAEREEAHRLHNLREAEADRQQVDLNKYLYNTEAERAAAIQRQQESQDKTQRDNYERYGGRDRER